MADAAAKRRGERLLDPRLLMRLGSLHLRARAIVDGLFIGEHRGRRHGTSVEFAEHVEYSPGDEIRHIDWRVVGRTDRYYVRRFEEEASLRCMLLLDRSGSMGFAHQGVRKADYAAMLAAAVAYLLVGQRDAVGLVGFHQRVDERLPPRSQRSHLQQLLQAIDRPVGGHATDLPGAVAGLAGELRRRGLVLLLSDLFVEPEAAVAALKPLAARGHDVRVVQVLDPAELRFPFEEPTLFVGMEGEGEVLASPREIRRAYQAEIQAHNEALRRGLHQAGIAIEQVTTDEYLDVALGRVLGGSRGR